MKTNIASNRRQLMGGFTLIEIMLVLAIIALLAGTAIYKLGGVMKTGEKARVKSDLGTIQTALLNYKISAGSYPTTEQGLSALITKPADVRAWEGPYFKGGTITDPWNQEYGYRFPGQNQGTSSEPDIFSKGPDGLENTEDDIGNWKVE